MRGRIHGILQGNGQVQTSIGDCRDNFVKSESMNDGLQEFWLQNERSMRYCKGVDKYEPRLVNVKMNL